ncbi:MAG TPA: transglycosylase domain-containing protein, partial [Vicinamibacterales bacterium]|nr:transglycosylase domain-containing protein [Vicinamibacterales bacterium]
MTSRLVRSFGIIALFLAAAFLGTASGVIFAFLGDSPQISALDDYSLSTITRVYGRDGTLVGDFATERRTVVTSDQIPEVMKQAFIAAEDGNFMRHSGIDPMRIAITIVRRATGLQQSGGASTITQQLARKLFLTDEQTYERKIREWIVAIQIEKRYTKDQILTMYCNKMYWGHGAYGVEAASQLFFAKHVKDVTLGEAAMIAGIHQGNYRQSPYVNMKAAIARRNYTLDRMAEEGFITGAQATEEKAKPIVTMGEPSPPASMAPYFLENVRQHLESTYGAKALYENGLAVKTGLDPALQRASTAALEAGLRVIDKRRGYRRPAVNVLDKPKTTLESYRHPRWNREPAVGGYLTALVMGYDGDTIRVRAGSWQGTIARADYAWTRRKPGEVVRAGDLVDVLITKVDPKASTFIAKLDQEPAVQGAVVAVENRTGQILAMVGGADFERSKFNRATQALRQVGSLFKPFVYTAAIDLGYTAQSIIDDSPASFPAGPNQPPYEPKNYDHEFHGPITLRQALEGSRNIPAVKMMEALTPAKVIPYARQLGVTTPIPPFLSVAIGAAEGTLLEMTSAYATFPNQGVRMTPLMLLEVTDREGNTLEQHR